MGAFKDVYSPKEVSLLVQDILFSILKTANKVTIDTIPMADGGEYSNEVLAEKVKSKKIITSSIVIPTGVLKDLSFLLLKNKTAFIGSYKALGLSGGQEDHKNPLLLTSYGLGQLIKQAYKLGVEKIILGLGGTNTVDAGVGLAQALGVKFLDKRGRILVPKNGNFFTGADLIEIFDIELSSLQTSGLGKSITILCDSEINVMEMGGATNAKIGQKFEKERNEINTALERGLINYSNIVNRKLNNLPLFDLRSNKHIKYEKGFGNAGGVLLSLVLIYKLNLVPGVDFFIKTLNLESHIKNSDLVITGEGKFDETSLKGKSAVAVSRLAKKNKVPAVFLCGSAYPTLIQKANRYIYREKSKAFKEIGITALISCDKYYQTATIPTDYKHKISFFKNIAPKVFKPALKEFFEKEKKK